MMQLLRKYGNIVLTTTIGRRVWPMSDIASTSGRLHIEFVRLLFLQAHRETDRFFAVAVFRIVLNLDGAPIASKSHTHPSHSQTVCSLPLHRHSYIGFILDFDSSFHNKQEQY
jgi:hypothetical protein